VAPLPAPPTPTLGREDDLARLATLLGEGASRLITVVGPGGVGKTRLAVETARAAGGDFADGAFFVPLAPVGAPEHVAPTIARQLDVALLPGEPVEVGLARHLARREALVVLDNFEHVLDAAPLVAELLAESEGLRVLVTSREPLHLQAERLLRLDPLPEPGSVELFLSVARARDERFAGNGEGTAAVASVCRQLDGLPLAIELAAARIGVLTVPELAERLGDGLAALGSGARDAPARQRTLVATLQWSYDLLSEQEREGLLGLAVFAGGCTLEAAQTVTGASLDVLEALVEKNLVVHRPVPGRASRLYLLETVAAFARERLGAGADPRRRHLAHYLDLAQRLAPELERTDAPERLAEIDLEIHNIRSALTWALDHGAPLPALQLVSALQEYWDQRDIEREAAAWLDAAFAQAGDDVPDAVRGRALVSLAFMLASPDTVERGIAVAEEGLALARSMGDLALCAAARQARGSIELSVHRIEEAHRHGVEAEAFARAAGDEHKGVRARQLQAITAPTLEEALRLGEDVAARHRRVGAAGRLAGFQTSLTYTALYFGDLDAARRLDAEAVELAETIGNQRSLGFAYGNHGLVSLLSGELGAAAQAFARELEITVRNGYHRMLYEAISGLAAVAAVQGEDDLAARLDGAAEATGPDRHDPVIARRLDAASFDAARARLGEPGWRRAHAAGAALSTDEAVALAREFSTGSRALGRA
jgi:predicted ATPase